MLENSCYCIISHRKHTSTQFSPQNYVLTRTDWTTFYKAFTYLFTCTVSGKHFRRVSDDIGWPANTDFFLSLVKGDQIMQISLAPTALSFAHKTNETCFPLHPTERSPTQSRYHYRRTVKKLLHKGHFSTRECARRSKQSLPDKHSTLNCRLQEINTFDQCWRWLNIVGNPR